MDDLKKNSFRFLIRFAVLLIAPASFILFCVLFPEDFNTFTNYFFMTTHGFPVEAVMALGVMFVMSIKKLDLSVGALASFSAAFGLKLAEGGYAGTVCIFIPLLVCLTIGLLTGVFASGLSIPSYLFTLATASLLTFLIYQISKGSTQYTRLKFPLFSDFGFFTMLAVYLIIWIFWCCFKNHFNKYVCFMLCALLAGLSGQLYAFTNYTVYPTAPNFLLLRAYAAVFLACLMKKDGRPCILSTFYGAVTVSILSRGIGIFEYKLYDTSDLSYPLVDFSLCILVLLAIILQTLLTRRENTKKFDDSTAPV